MAQSNSFLQIQHRSTLLVWSPLGPRPADQRPQSTISNAHTPPCGLSSVQTQPCDVWPYEMLVPVMIVQAHSGARLAASWARGAPHAIVIEVRVSSAVAAADRMLEHAPTSKPKVISWQSLSARTSFCPSWSQLWACNVITVTSVRGSSAYARHSDHSVTEVGQSDVPQRLSHHPTLQLEKRKGHNDNWRREKGQNAVVVRRAK